MTIKIKGLNLKKDKVVCTRIIGGMRINDTTNIEGKLELEISQGKVKGNSEYEIADVSYRLREELYGVLTKIEDELNGVKNNTTTFNSNTTGTGVSTTTNEEKYSWEEVVKNSAHSIEKIISKIWSDLEVKNSREIKAEEKLHDVNEKRNEYTLTVVNGSQVVKYKIGADSTLNTQSLLLRNTDNLNEEKWTEAVKDLSSFITINLNGVDTKEESANEVIELMVKNLLNNKSKFSKF